MSHVDGTFEFHLSRPIRYSKGGEFVEGALLEFSEYSGAHRKHYLKLQKAVNAAMVSAQKSLKELQSSEGYAEHRERKGLADATEDDVQMDAEEKYSFISTCFNFADCVDDNDFVDTFRDMVCGDKKPLCKIDGEHDLKATLFDDMHPNDQMEAALRYCAFFGIGLAFLSGGGSNTFTTRPTRPKAL